MRVSRPVAVAIGLVTIGPIVHVGLFLTLFLTVALGMASHQTQIGAGAPPADFERLFGLLVIGHVGTMLVSAGLLVFYIVHVFKNTALQDNARVLWTIIIFMGNVVAMPVYWYLHIWKQAVP